MPKTDIEVDLECENKDRCPAYQKWLRDQQNDQFEREYLPQHKIIDEWRISLI